MKHLKNIKQFNESLDNLVIQEISDIFIHLEDYGLEFEDVYKGTSVSMGTNDIVTDIQQIPFIIGSDGKYAGSFRSLSIRLKPKYVPINDTELYTELKSAIGHVESQFGFKLRHIYLRTPKGIWFNNVDVFENFLRDPLFDDGNYLKLVAYIDITFEDFTPDVDDSV